MTYYMVVAIPGAFNPSGGTTVYALVAVDNQGTSSESATVMALYSNATSAKFSADARNGV